MNWALNTAGCGAVCANVGERSSGAGALDPLAWEVTSQNPPLFVVHRTKTDGAQKVALPVERATGLWCADKRKCLKRILNTLHKPL